MHSTIIAPFTQEEEEEMVVAMATPEWGGHVDSVLADVKLGM